MTTIRSGEIPASPASARALCYLFGPLSAVFFLLTRTYNRGWAVRFHAVHSILFFGWWVLIWSALEFTEGLSGWFFASVVNEIQLGFNIVGVLMWAALMHAAHQGSRLVILQPMHILAARLASRGYRRAPVESSSRHGIWICTNAALHPMRIRESQGALTHIRR